MHFLCSDLPPSSDTLGPGTRWYGTGHDASGDAAAYGTRSRKHLERRVLALQLLFVATQFLWLRRLSLKSAHTIQSARNSQAILRFALKITGAGARFCLFLWLANGIRTMLRMERKKTPKDHPKRTNVGASVPRAQV